MSSTESPTLRPGVSTLRCPSCGGTVAIRVPGQTVTVICQNCNSGLDLTDGAVSNVVKYEKRRIRTALPIGVRGKLRGQELEVIGVMQKREGSYSWDEYLLFNPRLGYRWLVNDHGHWNLGNALSVPPIDVRLTFTSEYFENASRGYKRYHIGKATVGHVLGEFYWRVRQGETASTVDFIAPPFMLSAERSDKEINWTRLEYVEPSEIAAAFNVEPDEREGVAPNQPDPNVKHRSTVIVIAVAALVAALLVQLGFAFATRTQRVVSRSIPAVMEDGQPYVIGPLFLTGRKMPVEIASYANVNNNWLDLNVALVNDADATNYEFTQSIEQYSGRDSDGYWSEGSNNASSLIASVPSGSYHLVIEPSSGTYGPYAAYQGSVSIDVTRGAKTWPTFWAILIALAIYPAWLFVQRHLFLVKRWENSEFTPYSSDDDDDE